MRIQRFRPSVAFVTGVVVSLVMVGSFQAWRADAVPGGSDTTFDPIAPCRLFDYRPAPDTVGTRTSPLGPGEVHQQQVTGAVGNCSIPSHAKAVAMNVTIVSPTARSYLSIFPADETSVPTVSSLNWLGGQSPTPNKVDVKLSPSGAIKLFNYTGSVYVLADVVGFYSDRSLDQIQSRLVALETRPEPYVAEVSAPYPSVDEVGLTSAAVKALTLPTFVAPADGHVVLTATAWVRSEPSGEDVYCAILPTNSSPAIDTLYKYAGSMMHETDGLANDSSVSGSKAYSVSAGESVSYSLWCQREPSATVGYVYTRNLIMTYLPG